MIRQCGECLKILGEKAPLSDTTVTHGICYKCSIKQLRKAGITVTKEMRETLRKAS
jgi:hypothetical protein